MGGRHSFDDPEIVARVRSMRASGSTYVQIKAELGIGASTISRILGVAGRGRARPRVTDEAKDRARSLRRAGCSVPEIAAELALAKSTVWLITKDIQWLPDADRAERKAQAAHAGWRERNRRTAVDRQRQKLAWAHRAGELTDRELLLVGASIYWAEGGKDKPWRRSEHLQFVNSDPTMIMVFLRWLDLLGVHPGRRTFRIQIHETADVNEALRYWSEVTSVPVTEFKSTTVKRHRPKTNRHNTGATYYGCLVVYVQRSAQEYRAAEGLWVGLAGSAKRRAGPSLPDSDDAIP